MEKNLEIEGGIVKVSNEVIGAITTIAAMEVDGVLDMGSSLVSGIAEMFGRKYEKGVKVEIDEKDVTVTLSIIVRYGIKISEVSANVQQNVKRAIEKMASLRVEKININIQGVRVEKKKEEKEKFVSYPNESYKIKY